MNDDIAVPAPPPPDFVILFLQGADAARVRDVLLAPPSYLLIATPIILIMSVVLWYRGATFTPLALWVYSSPALIALVSFVVEFHALGNNIGLFHGYIHELAPRFDGAFIRLLFGALLSVILFALAVLFRAFRYRHSHFYSAVPEQSHAAKNHGQRA